MTTRSEFFKPKRGLLALCLCTLLAGSACGDETDPMSMMPGVTGMSGTGGPAIAGSAAAGMTGTVTAGTPAPSGAAGAAGTGIGAGAAGRGSMSGAAGSGAGGDGTTGRGPGMGGAGRGMPGAAGGGAAGSGAAGGGAAGAAGGGAAGSGSSNGAYNPCPPAGMPCRVLPFGDSITFGLGGMTPGSYRPELFSKAVMAGKSMTFVGPMANGPMTVAGMPFPRDHEGTSGITIDGIARRVPSPALDEDPNIILIHIGTNDMRGAAATAPMRLGTLLDKIIMAKPDALLVVAKIIPLGTSAAVRTYNDAIPAIVDERAKAGKHVILVDQYMGFPQNELADTVHPNDAGYRRMAGVWFEAIKDLLR